MVKSWAELVEEFMRLNDGVPPPSVPTVEVSAEIIALRQHLMMEELGELTRAINDKSIVLTADAIADLLYVVVGTGVALGLGPLLDTLFREVHASNMTKELGPAVGPQGARRAIKGPNYRSPQIAVIITKELEAHRELERKKNAANPLCTCGHRKSTHTSANRVCAMSMWPAMFPSGQLCRCEGFVEKAYGE